MILDYKWFPVEVENFTEDIIHAHRDQDENPFMRRIVATIFKYRVNYAVMNSKLIVKSDRDIQITDFTEREEWVQIMEKIFQIQKQDVLFGLNFLEERNVDIFETSTLS